METRTSTGKTRKTEVIDSAKELQSKIFKEFPDAKIGIVTFSGNKTGILALNLTNNENTVLSTLQSINNKTATGGTNINAGLVTANSNFTQSYENKMIILLTDGLPTGGVGDGYSDIGNPEGVSEASKKIYGNTKYTIEQVAKSNTSLVSLMTGMNDKDANQAQLLTAVKSIFGTEQKPTAGKFYNIADADLNKIITNDIFTSVTDKVENPIKDIVLEDYFPKDIIEKFDFSYEGNPSLGKTTNGIDEDKKSITWYIGNLKNGETATLKYKLKIKDMKSKELLNKVISTNEKVLITCTDIEKKYEDTLEDSPKVKLVEKKEGNGTFTNTSRENENELHNGEDNTTADKVIPQTGESMIILPISMITIALIIVTLYKYRS